MNKLVCESIEEFIGLENEMNEKKKEKWIGKAFKSIEKKGTEGKCTGEKYGGPSCSEGSKQYNMAKNLRKIARKRKKKTTSK
jgi:hypothetical protein